MGRRGGRTRPAGQPDGITCWQMTPDRTAAFIDPGKGILTSGFVWVELRGFEPLTTCMPCSFGLLSHPRSEVRTEPTGLLEVTVTDRCCTRRLVCTQRVPTLQRLPSGKVKGLVSDQAPMVEVGRLELRCTRSPPCQIGVAIGV
jgi:hypothetical protein